jgi:ABC-type multidrug transport system fused ATPase/permease subunit
MFFPKLSLNTCSAFCVLTIHLYVTSAFGVFVYLQAAGMRAGQVLGAITTLVSALSIAFVFGWKLAFLLMIAVPILVFASYQLALINRRYQQWDADVMNLAGKVRKFAYVNNLML